ncbi:carboxymuconolactone decarboxylase family protein [Paraherbaspirillum soli]|uniref:Carboxymuconolactone decarboxylase family protein n=1 Tax=Paraherbaspirillum soli TaxID=631222 RepID=A0ABW0M8T9_9BURK
MQARIKNPALTVPEAMPALIALGNAAKKAGVAANTLDLIYLRASQINGCSVCVDMHSRDLKKLGETDERLYAVAAWRETAFFTEAERAVLALTEAATRAADRPDAVPDEIWNAAAKHYDEAAMAALVLNIALINFWNRVNLTTRQVAGAASK